MIRKKESSDMNCLGLIPKQAGKINNDKIIYYICENNKELGFFAMYRDWLEYLYLADMCGYCPVIDAGKDFAYCESGPVHGTQNAFEYYFRQPGDISLKKAVKSRKAIYSSIIHRNIVELVYTGSWNSYNYSQSYLRAMGDVVRKYMIFNEYTRMYIEKGLCKLQLAEGKALGIHIRGTDFRNKFNNHPVYITPEECFPIIDKLILKNGYDKIFIATDDVRVLSEFLGKYGEKLCYYKDVIRNNRNKSVVFQKNPRKMHKYRLGLEVIRDMYTLARCDGLIAGISQVAVCAQINKYAMGEEYKDLEIINKGIYKNTNNFYTR